MKKYLLMTMAVMLLTATAAKAQSFVFQYHGVDVPDGGMVTIAAVEDDFGFGEMWCESNPSSNPDNGLILKSLTGDDVEGSATMTISHNTLNADQVTWCMGGTCMSMSGKDFLAKDFISNNGIVRTMFDATNCKSTGYLLATLEATVQGETHSVVIQFTNGESAGISTVEASQADNLAIYDLSGRRVLNPEKGLYIIGGKKVLMK